MSSDKIKEWESRLPPHHRQHIDDLIENIRTEMDKVIKGEETVDYLINRFISLCDEIGLPREETSVFIKYKLKGIVSDDTIERHLPKDRKRKYERYQDHQSRNADLPQPVTVSTSGSQSTTDSDGNEQEKEIEQEIDQEEHFPTYGRSVVEPIDGIAEEAARIALQEKNVRLNEAFALVRDKEKRIEELEIERANFEMELGELKKNPPKPKDDDENENWQIKYAELLQNYEELREVESLRTKQQDMAKASQIAPSVKAVPTAMEPWTTTGKMVTLWQAQRKCIAQANAEPKWNPKENANRKIFFASNSQTGEITGCHLEP